MPDQQEELTMTEGVKIVLEKLRPYVKRDGGDIWLTHIDEENGIVYIQLAGACSHCALQDVTLKQGIERALKDYVPGVKEVRAL